MKGSISFSAAILMAAVLSTPALAQQVQPRVMHNGNVDIVFEGATNSDLNIDQYKAFDQFESAHPDIIRQLRMRPKLVDSQKYLTNHPQLAQFMSEHPDWKADFVKNPGNYLPRSRSAEKAAADPTVNYQASSAH
ncbi:MAG TPA: hypothetical protein VJX23_12080 [Candidatus Binataceae bacterium]|nr:hypothetical protein [Candidatus Binataceae bacterium]